VLAHGFGPDAQTPDYTLLQGDLTAAYSKKVRQMTRSFVFLNLHNTQVPAALVVFDRVISADPDFRKYWLLHTLEEPGVEAASATVDCAQHGASGRLNLDVLLPPSPNAALSKVGGPGKEYWVFGTNYANDPDPERVAKGSIETSAWRLELSPQTASAEDHFLTVMRITDRTAPARWPVRRVDIHERTGCLIEGPSASWMILLRRDTTRSASPVEFTVAGPGPTRVLVADLVPGRWQARRAGSLETHRLDVAEDSGTAWFEATAGAWTLSQP
jgi:heparin/heparan-sulfate lyase